MSKSQSTIETVPSVRVAHRLAAYNRAYYAARSLRYDARERAECITGMGNAELESLRTLDAYAMGRR